MQEKTKPQVEITHYQGKYDCLDRFISYYFQIKAIADLSPATLLEIGVGNGTVSNYLKDKGFKVVTCDIDAKLNPDKVGDIAALPFQNNEFDTITAFEVLEHLPLEKIPSALKELHRVCTKNIIISIPYNTINIYGKFKIIPFVKPTYFLWRIIELFWIRHKFDGQHYWEMGKKGVSRKKIRTLIRSSGLKIIKEFTPEMNPYHYFFVLEKDSQANTNSSPN